MEKENISIEGLTEFVDDFRTMLVRYHNWTVSNAYSYNHEKLSYAYEYGLSVEDAHYNIWGITPTTYKDTRFPRMSSE